jgi:RHS repeat-associated protein
VYAHHFLGIHYLSGAIFIQNNGRDSLLYAYTDNQGSLVTLTDQNSTVIERYAYDPWGARRNPDDWTQKDNRSKFITNRGYTMHEHLDAFGIINMNGRVYDPVTAMFFSPDPFVQAPGDWVNYNRYSYCMNNPLINTDPSGYVSCATGEKMFWELMRDGYSYADASYMTAGGGYWRGSGDGSGGGGFSSAGHWDTSTKTTMYTNYSINSNGDVSSLYIRFETQTSSEWVWNSESDRMYSVLHPEITKELYAEKGIGKQTLSSTFGKILENSVGVLKGVWDKYNFIKDVQNAWNGDPAAQFQVTFTLMKFEAGGWITSVSEFINDQWGDEMNYEGTGGMQIVKLDGGAVFYDQRPRKRKNPTDIDH